MPLQYTDDLTLSRAGDFISGKAWEEAQKRQDDLIAAQFESIKAIVKTIAGSGNAIIKGLGNVARR